MILSVVVRASSLAEKLIFVLAAAILLLPLPNCFSQTCAPVPSGVVGWWGGEGNANDVLGQNNGTLFGNTTFVPGKVGQAFFFGGNGSAVTLNNNPNLQLQDFTIEAWIQRGSLTQPTSDELIFSYGHGGYGFGISPDGTPFITNIDIDAAKPAHQITDTNFHHLAVTKSGTSVVFYVDGVAYSAPFYSTSYAFNTAPAIGARGDDPGGSGFFLGKIDEVSVYDHALSAAEIQGIYNAGGIGKCSSTLPSITMQPSDQTVPAGAAATFSVQTATTGPLTYQWQLGTGAVVGATNSVLLLNNVQAISAGYYSVIVSNSVGSITSSSALLTVMPDSCVQAPVGLVGWWQGEGNAHDFLGTNNGTLFGHTTFSSGEVGQAFQFDGNGSAVTLNNNPNLQLQDFTIEAWIQRGSLTQPTRDEMIFSYGDGGYGFGISPDGTPFITKVDVDASKPAYQITDTGLHHLAVTKSGTSVVFYVDGVSYPAPSYSTSYAFYTAPAIGARGDDPGGSSDFLGTIDEVSVYNRALSAVEIQGIYNAGNSGKCTTAPPLIITQPANQSEPVGSFATFRVLAGGFGPFTYQWQFGGIALSGATNSTFNVTNVQATNAGNYSVIVSNLTGSVTSSDAVLTVTPNNCTPPVSGLVGWWQGEGNANDSVGGNNGTLIGNVIYAGGNVGQAFVINGSGSYISLNNTAALRLQNFTIEAWIQRGNLNLSGDQCIFGYGDGGYVFGIRQNGTLFLSKVDFDVVSPAYSINDTGFHHVAVAKNGTNVVFYVDGTAYPAPAYNTTYGFNTLVAIGSRGDNFSGNFTGEIDEVSVYNRALLSSEIQSIYSAGNSGKCLSSAPPVINSQPTNLTALPGAIATFSVIGAGSYPLSYIWRFNGTTLNTATNSTLSLSNAQLINAGNYSVIISNAWGSVTSAVATLTVQGPPAIISQPANQTVVQGASAVFSVDAASGPLSYKWRFNVTNAVGINDYALIITNAQAASAGAYSVVVTNSFGSVTSAPAVLTVLLPPFITNQPVSQTNYLGGNAFFTVGATTSGSAILFYQWRFNGTNLAAATNSTLVLFNLQSGAAGNYSVVVTNLYGKITSSIAALTLSSPSCDSMPSGLVGWWQGEGSTADVISGNLGTLTGNATYASGKVGKAFNFNGNAQAVSLGNPTNFQLQTFTIDAWVRRSSTNHASLSSLGGSIFGYGSGGYALGQFDNGQIYLTQIDVSYVGSSVQVADTNWHHLAVTKSGTNVVFYVDGLAYPAPAYSATFSFNNSVAIGARGDNFNSTFLGSIDEVDLFNRALSAAEVQAIYAATSVGKCPVPLSILTQPTNQSLTVGSNATLSIGTAGTGPITYQWFLNGALLNGATNATLQLTHATFFQAGSYSVTISNALGKTIVSNIVLNVQPPVLLVNGSFETGDFTGWVTSDISLPLYPLTVRTSGFDPDYGLFLTAPTDGNFCATDGFEGNGPGKISIAQDVYLPSGPALLTFDYRMAWDMLDYGGSTLPRTFNVSIQPYGGGVALHTFTMLSALSQTADEDTGPLSGSLDLSPYSDRRIRISFDANIPESYTGPGFFQLDHVALSYSVLPPLIITKSNNNLVLSWPASTTNYTLQANGNLRLTNGWSVINPNLIVHGATNTTATLPLPLSSTFYRLKYP